MGTYSPLLSMSVLRLQHVHRFNRLITNMIIYSTVIAVALGGIPLLSWIQGIVVTSLRKPAKVRYPQHYATAEQCKENVRPLHPFPK
jgi:hypothetical protein